VAEAVKEIAPYLVGKDPRRVAHHWQAIYRHAFYRGGPVLTSALSGIDMALWDIKGKALGVPVYELLGGPTRDRVRVYAHARGLSGVKEQLAQGFTAFKTGPAMRRPGRYVESPAEVGHAAERFGELRKIVGDDVDIAIDFHGAISPATAKLLIKAIEPFQPMFVEEPCQAQNHDVMAEIARGTHLPIATGERVFTKWGFREVLEKRAATILQPDMCHAGPARGVDPELPLPGAGQPGRGLPQDPVPRPQGLYRRPHRPRPRHRARRGRRGRQARP
jgi:galactonate dehydratase